MTQVPITQKYCSCTDEFYNPTETGKKQKEFEELRQSGLSIYTTLTKMRVFNLCCRETLFNPPMLFLNSENVGRIRDETNVLTSAVLGRARTKNQETIRDTPDILPKKELPELP
jgi:hypothetical protein